MQRKRLELNVSFRGDNIPVYISPWPVTFKNENGDVLRFDLSYDVVYLTNLENKLFYFTKDHSIPKNIKGNGWVPVTASIPGVVKPRETCPTGFVTCLDDLVKVFLYDCKYMGVI